ncbi:MAG: RsmD family RNA methyltransferase [Alistipes indistinctus]
MRIVSGRYRGGSSSRRRICAPVHDGLREGKPVQRNCQPLEIEGVDVLDLFSGTGSISCEFASRGAGSIVSVEINAIQYNYIRSTARRSGFPRFMR